MAIKIQHCVRTLRLKVKREGYAWLNAAAIEVKQVWNYANATSYKAARPFAGTGKWLSAFDLDKLTAGATEYFDHIGSETIQRVNAEFATRRNQFKKAKLRWRVSQGAKRSLGWVPFKAVQLKRKGNSLRFSGKAFRVFERDLLEAEKWKSGCFAQDAAGDWWLCVPVEREMSRSVAPKETVGIERRGHKRQAKRLHRTAARRRKDALHKFSRKIVNDYQTIKIGDVSSLKLAKTRMAKSVLDAGWGMLKTQLQYKGQQAGRSVIIVNERDSTRTCSSCKALMGPTGLDMLVIRTWVCGACGDIHDRDVNAARNILSAGRSPPSVSGNEPSLAVAEPSLTYGRCEAMTGALKAAA
jgi:IS605 OrfB family transposase